MPEITVVDTSSLFYFHRVGLFELFKKLYGHITVPEAVKNELFEGQTQGEDVPQLESYPWVEIRSVRTVNHVNPACPLNLFSVYSSGVYYENL